ncbi:MAG: YggT family protein [Tabrizicola sp.]|jgi:YggT family protein|nr:YggT family protein [Tabrizicola sp.]
MIALRDTLLLILNIAYFLVLLHFILSWLVSFQVLNMRQPLVAQVWNGLNGLLQPVYGRIRRVIPPISGIDFSPIIVIIAIYFLQRLVATQVG